jgi:hypothetical protein
MIHLRWNRHLPVLLFAGLMIGLYSDPLFFRRNFGGRDLTAYNLAMEKSVHDAWSRGRLPVWQPEISGGRPLLPNPNAGALYPVRALLAPLPLPLAVRISPVLHWMAAGIGMIVFALSLKRSRLAAWLAGVTYAFSGVAVGEVFSPHIQPGLTLLPWIVWAAQRRSGSSASRLLLLSFLLALDMLAADIFTITLAVACAALWIALEEDSGHSLRAFGRLGLAIVLALLAAAPQIVATALWIPLTNRAVLGMKLGEVLLFSIHPWRLVEFIIPFPFGPTWRGAVLEMWGWSIFGGKAMGVFSTLYAGAFVVFAVGVAWKSRERGARFARVVLVTALLASVVPSLRPSGWASLSSPLPLRAPEKLAVTIMLALALLSAIAFDAWNQRPRRLGWAIGVGGVLAAISLLAAVFPEAAGPLAVSATSGDAAMARLAGKHLPKAFVEAGLLWMMTVVALDRLGAREKSNAFLAVALLTLVPILSNRKIARSFPEQDIFTPTAFARLVARRDPEGAFRTLDESLFRRSSPLEEAQYSGALSEIEFSRRTWYHLTPLLFGRGTVFNEDFDSGDLSRVESLRKVSAIAAGFRDSDSLFGGLALRFGIRYRDQDPVAGYRPIGGDALQVWDEHIAAYPDVRLLERWSEVPGPVEAFRSIARLRSGEIVIEDGASQRGAAAPGLVHVLQRSAERLVVDVEAIDPGWLFVLRAYWPYRSIDLDGKPVEAFPAQLAFCAVPIPPGRHRLQWKENIPGFGLSRWGPVLFGAIAAGLAIAHSRRRKP